MRRLRKLKELSVIKKAVLVFSSVVLLVAITCATYLLYSIITTNNTKTLPIAYDQSSAKKAPPNSISGNPTVLQIPTVGITLPIVNGAYSLETNSWTLTADMAQFATETSPPNNMSGKTFLYGHANAKVFRNLNKVKSGETAYTRFKTHTTQTRTIWQL
jgi:sortase (surface protein transpeptidase)